MGDQKYEALIWREDLAATQQHAPELSCNPTEDLRSVLKQPGAPRGVSRYTSRPAVVDC